MILKLLFSYAKKNGKQARKEQFLGYDDRDPNVVLLHGAESFNINNPNDIMPLAFERKIGGHYGKATPDLYFAVNRLGEHVFCDSNPLRAIACILLMMDE